MTTAVILLEWLFVFLVLVALYFVPTFVAVLLKSPNAAAVTVVNLLLGWTCIGWIVALAMAVSGSGVQR
jgi:hypothetical protein